MKAQSKYKVFGTTLGIRSCACMFKEQLMHIRLITKSYELTIYSEMMIRPPNKSVKLIKNPISFLNPNICCGYSKEPSYVLLALEDFCNLLITFVIEVLGLIRIQTV